MWDERVAKELLKEEKQNGDVRRRSKQAVIHLAFTEMRITELERHIRKLEAELHNKPDGFQLSVVRRQAPTYKASIKSSSHGEFLLNPQSLEIPLTEHASFETLVAEHGTPAQAILGLEHDAARQSTSASRRTHPQTPERLRIRYAPLIRMLEKISREALANSMLWPTDSVLEGARSRGAASVFLRPWKFFVAYEKEIRESVHKIDTFIAPAHPEDVSGGVVKEGLVDECEFDPYFVPSSTAWSEGHSAEWRVLISYPGFSRI